MDKRAVYTLYATSGGACAAIGSLFGKLSGSYDYLLIQLALFVAMVSVNTFGFMLFAKSLNLAPSSLQPMLLSTASSYISSAVLGFIFYGEVLSSLWWLGTVFVISGMLIQSLNKVKAD